MKCDECGEEFNQPLLARISSKGNTQTYYACPHCLTRVQEPEKQQKAIEKHDHEETHVAAPVKELKTGANKEEVEGCQHFFGFLKKRPKDTAIPETCLICDKMIECMVH